MDTHDVIVIGAGLSGMYQLHRLRQLGLSVRVFEAGGGVGGTWYWNRYPGARFDSESWTYGYLLLRRAAAGVGVERALRGAARDAALLQLRRRQARPAARHLASTAGSRRPRTTTPRTAGRSSRRDGRRARARFLITAIGPLSAPTMPTIPGVETFRGEAYHTGTWPHAAGELRGQARRRDRHRRHRRAGDHRDRQDSRPPHGVPAHAELVRAAAQQPDRRRDAAPDQGSLPGDLRALPRLVRLLHPRGRSAQRARGAARGARGLLREALRRARLRHLDGQLPRHPDRPGGQRHDHRVHAPQDPRAREGSGARGRS